MPDLLWYIAVDLKVQEIRENQRVNERDNGKRIIITCLYDNDSVHKPAAPRISSPSRFPPARNACRRGTSATSRLSTPIRPC